MPVKNVPASQRAETSRRSGGPRRPSVISGGSLPGSIRECPSYSFIRLRVEPIAIYQIKALRDDQHTSLAASPCYFMRSQFCPRKIAVSTRRVFNSHYVDSHHAVKERYFANRACL